MGLLGLMGLLYCGSLGSPGPPGSFGSHVSYGSLASPGPPGSLWSLGFNGILSFLIEVSKLLRFIISEYLQLIWLYILGMGVAGSAAEAEKTKNFQVADFFLQKLSS